ncbi:MAG: DciA family protein [Puniceicoccales bacterium]|jgi:hypothetical protein|nr:DciA family protein [Puniceicoccales bacterium]
MKPSPLQHVRILCFDAAGVLFVPSVPSALHPARRWKMRADVLPVLQALRFLGYRMAALDGTDGHAQDALPALSLDGYFEQIFTPALSHDGTGKPRTAALLALAKKFSAAPVDILHIGTDIHDDVDTALAAGMRVAWLAPDTHFRPAGAVVVLRHLTELPDKLRDADTVHLQCKPRRRSVRNLVASLRGLPAEPDWSPKRRHEDPEQLIGAVMLSVAQKLRTEAAPIEVLRAHWNALIGNPKLVENCEPKNITKTGTLTITCIGAVVRTELQNWHGARILEAVKRLPACGNVRSVKFVL